MVCLPLMILDSAYMIAQLASIVKIQPTLVLELVEFQIDLMQIISLDSV